MSVQRSVYQSVQLLLDPKLIDLSVLWLDDLNVGLPDPTMVYLNVELIDLM